MGKQLRDMLSDLRAEIGHSTNVAHGINDRDTLLYYLNRTQIRLYQEFDWPQLIVSRDTPLAPSQRYYTYASDLAFDDIIGTWLFAPQPIQEVLYGIGPAQYAASNPDLGQRTWPVQRWMHSPDQSMFEVWPVPDNSAAQIAPFLRQWGTKTVTTMANDSDMSTLPDNIIVLFAAAELLARDNTKDAQLKLAQANEAMRRHRVRQGHGRAHRVGLD
jgi:hypothetical protein